MKKKLLILLALLVAMTLVFVACKDDPQPPVDDTTVADQPTEEPTNGEEDPSAAPDTDPETPEPGTDEPDEPTTPAPDTQEPDTPAPDTQAPETPEPETKDPMEPVNVFDAEDIQTVTGNDPGHLTQDCVTLEDGFVHIVPIGPDPYYYPFAGVDGARYVAIRYRTDATGADIQMYIGSTGGGPSDDSTMLRQPVVADSEWHVAIFDTQSLIDAGKYDGKYVSYFRFDALEAGYKLNENGETYKNDDGSWARYSLPEGCSIDVAYIGFFQSTEAAQKYDFEQYPPFSQPSDAGMKNNSFDTFYVNGQMYFPEDGNAGGKLDEINNTLTFASAAELQSITLRGWIGFDQPMDSFGYYVDNYEFVYGEFKTATEDGVLGAGGEFASRFEIKVPLEYLEGDDHFVGFVVKLADGTVVQLRNEITIDLPDLPKDITDSFVSDVNANEIGTTMDASDLANFFVTELPLPGSGVEANGEGKLYHLTSINDMYADVNGRYFIKANVIDSNAAGWMFARGYKVVNSDEIVEKFDPAGGFYKINNYYETDSAGAMGGAGIYARLQGGKLFLMVKYYNPETITRVGNKIYAIDAAGSELTLADNGSKVSVLVDGVTYATIELSGSIAYGDINEVEPAGEFAEKAVITLKDGTTETIENTLIAATCECQVGIVARAGSFKFDALAVGGYSAIEVPALEIETPEEPEPVDPDAPVLVLDPEYINELAGSTEQTVAQHIGSHEIITEDGVTFVRLTSNGGDPYVALVKLGSYLELPPYMAFAYRTNCDLDAHVFIGSGSGWNGNGDVASVAWNQDNNWNLAVLDLNNAGLTSIQNGIISYCRFDFFTGNGEGNMDVEYVAFFNSAEAAQKYFDKLHGGADEPETEEPEVPSEPEFYENLVVPQDQWVITGHNTQLNDNTNPMVAAGGVESAALLHQGSIALGEIDLSKYSKVVVMWGCDNSDVTINHYNANANNRIMLLNAEMSMVMSPAEGTIIAGGTYELKGWKVTAFEIDLTGVDYNGPVWLAIDALPGTFALISSVEFIGAEKVDEPEHQHEYTTVVTDPTCTEGGYTTYTCACGDSYVADETPAAGHNFVDGFCGICGEADPDYVKPLPSTPEEIVNAAYGLAEGATLEGTYTLTGVITSIDSAWSDQYGNISVWMQIGDMSDKPILAFRLAGEGAKDLKVGDTITVTGSLTNYYSKIEFAQGCTLDAVVPGEEPEPELPEENTIIIDFSDKANRTEFNANIQVWVNGDFVLTNNKAASTTDVADYANPARFYAHSEIIISGVNMTKLVFACDATKYVTALQNTLANASGISYTVEGMIVTVVFDTPVDSFVLADLTAQIRLDSVTVYVAAAETPDEPAANEIQVTTTDTYGWFDEYTFVADAAGNYTFTLPAGLGMWSIASFNSWGDPELDYNLVPDGGDVTVALAAGEEFKFLVGAFTKGDWTITYTFAEGEVGGGDEPDPDEPVVEDVVIVVGQNTINVTDAVYTEGGFEASFTVDVEGEYKFLGDFLVRIYNGMGMQLGTGMAYLTPGTYTLQIVTAYLPGAGSYGLTVELVLPEDPEDPEIPEEPSGNPVIESLPFTYEITTGGQDTFDVYYDFTAAEDVTLIITRPEGALVSLSGNSNDWDIDEDGNYVLFVPASETVCLNFWTMNPTTVGSFTVSEQAPAHTHEYTSNVTAPTCQADGYTTYTCACGDTYTTDNTPKVGHVFYAGVCTYCNGVLPTYAKWDVSKDIVKHLSFDQLYTVSATEGNIFPMGQEANWNKIAVIDNTVPQLYFWGWIGYVGGFGQFGYQIDCDTPVFDASFAVTAEQGVINAAAGVGATGASRVRVAIATAGMTAGVHTVNVLYKNAEGAVTMLSTFKVLVTDETGANATAYYSAEELVTMGATNATVTSTDGYAHVVTTDAVGGKNDPKFTFTSNGFSDIVVIKYKTNSPGYGSNYDGYFLLNGNQFIGNRSKSDNWYEYYGDGEWHYLVLNLRKNKASSSAAANTDVVDGASLTTVEFVPFDYAGNKSGKNLADEYIDIAYVAFY